MISEKEFYRYLSVLIKSKRKELNYTNEDLSHLSKIDYSKISLLQNAKTWCSAYTLYKILTTLGLDIFEECSVPKLDKKILEENIKILEKYISSLKNLL